MCWRSVLGAFIGFCRYAVPVPTRLLYTLNMQKHCSLVASPRQTSDLGNALRLGKMYGARKSWTLILCTRCHPVLLLMALSRMGRYTRSPWVQCWHISAVRPSEALSFSLTKDRLPRPACYAKGQLDRLEQAVLRFLSRPCCCGEKLVHKLVFRQRARCLYLKFTAMLVAD